MKVSGNAILKADVGRVYEALTDPRMLAAAIPGCERLELVAPDVYDMVVTVGVGSIKGTYKGRVELAEQAAPRSFTLRASGAGAPGTVSAECRMLLVDEADARTRVEYDADAVVGGVVGGVGQRMLGGVARKLAGQFFAGMDGALTREAAPAGEQQAELVPASAVHPTNGPVTAYPIVTPPGQLGSSSSAVALSAGLAGAAAALSGVVLGYVLGRLSGRRGPR
ncbi:SRPBCC family protein [Catenulispora pinisilvae]|uniref:SRPBCC family protein n=1 Tax=Catenulispora pinisilvae TaxID=2705253 RepID=UPI0018916980|nr:carbon monoxide dehydrogenase subunit G [Catenulispora pinisilvae]